MSYLCLRVSSSEIQATRAQSFNGIEKQGIRVHHAWAHLSYGTCIVA
jgi:hypothetical protein